MNEQEMIDQVLLFMEGVKFWMFIGASMYFLLIAFKLYRKENDGK